MFSPEVATMTLCLAQRWLVYYVQPCTQPRLASTSGRGGSRRGVDGVATPSFNLTCAVSINSLALAWLFSAAATLFASHASLVNQPVFPGLIARARALLPLSARACAILESTCCWVLVTGYGYG